MANCPVCRKPVLSWQPHVTMRLGRLSLDVHDDKCAALARKTIKTAGSVAFQGLRHLMHAKAPRAARLVEALARFGREETVLEQRSRMIDANTQR